MARRKSAENSSLELLLDTICNTFGGIIFLAILVAVLLQISGSPTLSASLKEPQATGMKPDDLKSQLEALRKLVEQQEEKLRQATQNLLANGSQSKVIDKQSLELRIAIARAERERRELHLQIQASSAARVREANLPMLRDTKKKEIPFFLKQQRLGALLKANGVRREVNKADFEATDLGTGHGVVKLKANSGIAVQPDGSSRDQITELLRNYDKSKEYIAVFIWPDSFETFSELRTAIVSNGFEYRLVPLPPEMEAIREGSGANQVQ
jgi:hypothetical protein